MGTVAVPETKTMLTLPGDAVRQIQWRFADRFDLQMLVQSARDSGPRNRRPPGGRRRTQHPRVDPRQGEMLEAFDRAGITAAFMEPEEGGFISGPKNLALSLAAFELAWVDGGAATASLAGFLALAPIHERGTPEQVTHYKTLAAPPQAGRRPQALARSLRPHRADSLRRRRHRHAQRQASHRGVERRARSPGCRSTSAAASSPTSPSPTSSPPRSMSEDPRIKGSCIVILEDD